MLSCAPLRKGSARWQLITACTFAHSLDLSTASSSGTLQLLLADFYENIGITSSASSLT